MAETQAAQKREFTGPPQKAAHNQDGQQQPQRSFGQDGKTDAGVEEEQCPALRRPFLEGPEKEKLGGCQEKQQDHIAARIDGPPRPFRAGGQNQSGQQPDAPVPERASEEKRGQDGRRGKQGGGETDGQLAHLAGEQGNRGANPVKQRRLERLFDPVPQGKNPPPAVHHFPDDQGFFGLFVIVKGDAAKV